ncbi:MAG: hypothetical protein C0506_13385 [Anaerolinea sp.]|nr:hypothetical protein [Anaerolinea sp.]
MGDQSIGGIDNAPTSANTPAHPNSARFRDPAHVLMGEVHMSNRDNYWLRRLESGRLSRRRFVGSAAVAGVGAAGLGLVGCGDDDDGGTSPTTGTGTTTGAASPTAVAETPKKGGQYTVAFTGPFAGADPHNSVYGGAGIVPVVYNYLFRNYAAFVPDRGTIYDLAASHELQADKVTIVFKLRNDVKIAPNAQSIPERVLDSSDVLASWQRIADPKAGANGFAFPNNWIDRMDAPDATTFRMILKTPYAWADGNVGNNLFGAIVPKEMLASADLKTKPVGAGPFRNTEIKEGAQATMERNPNYYKAGKPYLDKYVIRAFADQATWLTAFSSGQTDYYLATNPDEAKQLQSANKNLVYKHENAVGFNSFWMNTKKPEWADERVRKAVNLATNRDEYIQIIGRGAGEPIGPITYAFPKYALTKDELKAAQPFNVADAKKAFEAAGVKEFSFSHPTSSNMADYVNIFVRQMSAAGVTAKPQPLDAGTWVAGYFTSQLSASLSLNQAYQTPDHAVQWWATGGITGNNKYDTGWTDPAVDALIKKAAGTLDEPGRITAYKDLQKLILSKGTGFFNIYGTYTELLHAPEIKGLQYGTGALGTAFLADAWTTKG